MSGAVSRGMAISSPQQGPRGDYEEEGTFLTRFIREGWQTEGNHPNNIVLLEMIPLISLEVWNI